MGWTNQRATSYLSSYDQAVYVLSLEDSIDFLQLIDDEIAEEGAISIDYDIGQPEIAVYIEDYFMFSDWISTSNQHVLTLEKGWVYHYELVDFEPRDPSVKDMDISDFLYIRQTGYVDGVAILI